MQALQREYGEKRGWRMCGSASVALSRILSERTGVPIGKNISGEHIELCVGIYDPKEKPNRARLIEEQTYIRYYTIGGDIYYIDPIYGLLMGGKKDFKGAIQVEKYSQTEVDRELQTRHHLYFFDPNHPDITECKTFAGMDIHKRQMFIDDNVAALNDERATMSEYVADSGHVMSTDYAKTEGIIKEFALSYKPDLLAKARQLTAVAQKHLEVYEQRQAANGVLQRGFHRESVEIVYHDHEPQLESWQGDERKALTFHIKGERYWLKEGDSLEVFKNGVSLEVTSEQVEMLRNAIYDSGNMELINFFEKNISVK